MIASQAIGDAQMNSSLTVKHSFAENSKVLDADGKKAFTAIKEISSSHKDHSS